MSHLSGMGQIVVDVPPHLHTAELAFWRDVLGLPMTSTAENPEFHRVDLPGGPKFYVQRLEEGEPRVHLDVITDDLEAEVRRVEGLGARRVRKVGDGLWIMTDPAGLPFCVVLSSKATEATCEQWEDPPQP